MIWSLIVGAFIGMIAGKMTEKSQSMGCFTNIIAGLIGSAVGQKAFWGLGNSVGRYGYFPVHFGSGNCNCTCFSYFGKRY